MSVREWLVAGELAGLPGMPLTERGVRDLAARQAWPWRARQERDGVGRPAREYLSLIHI